MVVAQLTGLGREAKVGNGWNSNVAVFGVEVETLDPGVLGLVLEFKGQRLVLEVGKTGFSRDRGVTKTASLKVR